MAACGLDGVRDDVFYGHATLGNAVDERGVGAIFEQPTDQVGQEFGVATHRCVHPAPGIRVVVEYPVVQTLAHAVQSLKFEGIIARQFNDRGYCVCIVSGELGVEVR